ncbi:uncharacterized protein LOC105634355 [Jatropha curcas]|uniref:uncharacterized protein LOC105634355 n=1 Tax=Jatropha curcas TaxID=180498 RepID=UPI0005FB399D|nr:uncharacterized protein LOC105634355 [Jatropha curcas]
MKHHSKESAKKYKSLSLIHAAVTETIFTSIMACETGKETWDRLKDEFQGSEKTKHMQVLNLKREYELLKMKENESVKEYADRLMKTINQIRLLGEDLSEKRVIEKRKAYRLEDSSESALFASQKGKFQSSGRGKKPADDRKENEKGDYQSIEAKSRKWKNQSCSHCNKRDMLNITLV